jgi:hypothetical protein
MSNQVWKLNVCVESDGFGDVSECPSYDGIYSSETQALEALAMFYKANIRRILLFDFFEAPEKILESVEIDEELEFQIQSARKVRGKLIDFYNAIGNELHKPEFYREYIRKNFRISDELTTVPYESDYSELIDNCELVSNETFFPLACCCSENYIYECEINLDVLEINQWLKTDNCPPLDSMPDRIEK